MPHLATPLAKDDGLARAGALAACEVEPLRSRAEAGRRGWHVTPSADQPSAGPRSGRAAEAAGRERIHLAAQTAATRTAVVNAEEDGHLSQVDFEQWADKHGFAIGDEELATWRGTHEYSCLKTQRAAEQEQGRTPSRRMLALPYNELCRRVADIDKLGHRPGESQAEWDERVGYIRTAATYQDDWWDESMDILANYGSRPGDWCPSGGQSDPVMCDVPPIDTYCLSCRQIRPHQHGLSRPVINPISGEICHERLRDCEECQHAIFAM